MVTSNPARMLGRADEIGAIKVGREADISVLSQQTGRFILRDNEKNEVIAERLLQPCSACARAHATTRWPRSCRRRWQREQASVSAGLRGAPPCVTNVTFRQLAPPGRA